MNATLLHGDARQVLRRLPDGIFRACVTSPPYLGLRDYGLPPLIWGADPMCEHQWSTEQRWLHTGSTRSPKLTEGHITKAQTQADTCVCCGAWRGSLGLEPTPALYVTHLVEVLEEVRRVLTDDGTLWLNLGDSYAANRGYQVPDTKWGDVGNNHGSRVPDGLKPKDLIGIPWMVAFALRDAGWYLRSDIIWAKGNPMPESVTDRPTRSHEYLFLLSKQARYFYDHRAISEPSTGQNGQAANFRRATKETLVPHQQVTQHRLDRLPTSDDGTRNRRSVWTINTRPFKGTHFAVFPLALVEPCILAGSEPGDLVLDPFCGSGTTGEVALKHERGFVGIDLNPGYLELTRARLEQGK